jgi:hypothetical protein
MMLYYHIIIFSDFVMDPEVKFTMGYSFLSFFSLVILVNLCISFYSSFNNARIKMKRKKEKIPWIKRMKELVNR